MTDATLRQALAYARRGWPVFPCLPGQKIPATRHGYQDATTDEQQITKWFGRGQRWNLAIATGTPGPDVLDIDQHGPAGNGYPALATLERAGLLDGASAYVRTPAGGMHAYFAGSDQHNGRLPSHHLDFRSHGGYILAPPSQVDGKPYRLIARPGGHSALDWAAVTRLLEPQRHQQLPPAGRDPDRALAQLARWVASRPAGSPAGPKAIATPACTGPPIGLWTPTPPPTSARSLPPPARPASATARLPARSTPPAAPASPIARPRRSPEMTTDEPTVLLITFGRPRGAPGTMPRDRLDAGGTRLRLRSLHVMGHGSARIARALGVREETVGRLVRGDARTVSPPLRDAVTALYDAWWDKRAPERTRAERAAAARARRRAAAGNWCAGAALNDDQLDIPGYRPRAGYRPATGTGVAADVRLPVRQYRRKGA